VIDYGKDRELVLRYLATCGGLETADLDSMAGAADSAPVRAALVAAVGKAQAAVDATTSWRKTGNPMSKAHRARVAAQAAVAAKTSNVAVQELIGGMAEVLALQRWVNQLALIENALAPLVAVRPGWLEEAGL
jgi:hypothetical protein